MSGKKRSRVNSFPERRTINCLGIQTFSISTALLKQIPYFSTIFDLENGVHEDDIVLDEDPKIFQEFIKMVNYQVRPCSSNHDFMYIIRLTHKMGMKLVPYQFEVKRCYLDRVQILVDPIGELVDVVTLERSKELRYNGISFYKIKNDLKGRAVCGYAGKPAGFEADKNTMIDIIESAKYEFSNAIDNIKI